MQITNQSVEIVNFLPIDVMEQIHDMRAVCYDSPTIDERIDSDPEWTNEEIDEYLIGVLKSLRDSKHWGLFEHHTITVKCVTDRGISHEIVRHRIASYVQSSTRYIRYDSIPVIDMKPYLNPDAYKEWDTAVSISEKYYQKLLFQGISPQIARSVLPTCLATTIYITMNIREWFHFFLLRMVGVTGKPHPMMYDLASIIFDSFTSYPEGENIFGWLRAYVSPEKLLKEIEIELEEIKQSLEGDGK